MCLSKSIAWGRDDLPDGWVPGLEERGFAPTIPRTPKRMRALGQDVRAFGQAGLREKGHVTGALLPPPLLLASAEMWLVLEHQRSQSGLGGDTMLRRAVQAGSPRPAGSGPSSTS